MTARIITFAAFIALASLAMDSQAAFAQSSDIGEGVLINLDGAPFLGDKDAKITMVEFSDYECPFCGGYFQQTFSQLLDEYVKNGKVKYVLRDFPLESVHALASKAAEAAHCAGEQDKYWQMHDRLFNDQHSLDPPDLPRHASILRLDVPRFKECLNGKYAATVRESVEEGKKAGVKGTPWFFLGLTDSNGQRLKVVTHIEGSRAYSVYKEAIDKLLSLPKDVN